MWLSIDSVDVVSNPRREFSELTDRVLFYIPMDFDERKTLSPVAYEACWRITVLKNYKPKQEET